jgi:cell division septum initiation protein DivIVA
MKGRVKGLLGGTAAIDDPMAHADAPASSATEHQALQVLTLAQRTSEEHVASARRQAGKICADARATAEQIVREAQAHAHGLRQEADRALADARAAAALIAQDAKAQADSARRNAEEILSGAQARADELAKLAQADADELSARAQQRYDDVVGSLAARRTALQKQIEALEKFDQEYRARLTAFMQGQLRALWVDEPRVSDEVEQPGPAQAAPAPVKKRPGQA